MTIAGAEYILSLIKFSMPSTYESAPSVFERFEGLSNYMCQNNWQCKFLLKPTSSYNYYFSDNRKLFQKKSITQLKAFNSELQSDIQIISDRIRAIKAEALQRMR